MVVADSPSGVATLTPLTKGRCPVARICHDSLTDGHPAVGPGTPQAAASRTDWRGWLALAWVVLWGSAYAVMAIQARAPQVVQWLRHLMVQSPH